MNNEQSTPVIVGIRFSPIGKNYYFDATKLEHLKIGDFLIVQTSRGWQIGELTQFIDPEKTDEKMNYKPVDRVASEADIKKKEYLENKSEELREFVRKRISVKEISGVKLVNAELSFDDNSLTILYSTENENNINFNSITKEIKNHYDIKRIDFHKIGPRDVAKYLGGMGACGLECRCCSQFLDKFDSISIRMAKKQGISLTPSDITGMCNRLRCCLNYEYCIYIEALKDMPRRKKKVMTPYGEGIVKDLAPISKTVFVQIPEHGLKELGIDEIQEIRLQDNQPATKSDETFQNRTQQPNRERKFRKRRNPKNRKDQQNI
jgi:cell fate regulator YaaT (PSP1 superfamily)